MRTRLTPFIIITVLALALAAPSTIFAYGRGETPKDQSIAQAPSSTGKSADSSAKFEAPKSLVDIQYSFREVAQKVLPVVVEVDVTEQMQANQAVNPFEWFFNQQPNNNKNGQQRVQTGLGSGIIVRRVGNTYYVLTNNHVVADATTISVKLYDQTVFEKVKKVGLDKTRDLAVISFTSSANLPVADLGDSAELQVGDLVLAVGNPFGFENTVTMGIVSAVGRSSPTSSGVTSYTDYIQTDASINQGNSGGALVNIKGEVVGINTWIAAPTGGSIGLGFAVPINNAKQAINDFISKGKVEYGWLGISPQDPDADAYFGVAKDLKIEKVKGSLVLNVFKGSPAEKSGLQTGDYITRINGQDITDTNKLIRLVADLVANRSYDFELIRYGERMKLSIKLGVRPAEGSEDSLYKNMWPGITVVHINDQVRQQAQAEGEGNVPAGVDGVMIGYVSSGSTPADQSPAAVAGFRAFDVITSINGKDIHTVMDFYRALNDKSKKELVFRINRQGTDIMIGLVR